MDSTCVFCALRSGRLGDRVSARAPWLLIPQWFGSLLFDRSAARYLPFDHELTALLVRGTREPLTIDSVAEAKRDGLRGFLQEFYARGLFTLDMLVDADVLDIAPPHGHLTGPLVTHLEVNAVCNIACLHCFAGELPRKERSLSLDELEVLFADLAAIGSLRLALSGGEPLMRRDLFALIDLAIEQGIRTSITTNGLLIDEDIARELARRELLWISVSLDGATRETNDAIRGEGVFDRVLDRVKLLRGRAPFSLAMTVTSTNAHEARAFGALARAVGASGAVLRPLYPTGLAATRLDWVPSFAQYRRAIEELTEGADDESLCGAEPFGPAQQELDRADIVGNVGCGAGSTLAAISSSGVVSPCSFLGPAFDGPSIRQRSFSSIWNDSAALSRFRAPPGASSPALEGCRARALAHSGDALAPDPWIVAPEARAHDPLVTLRVRRSP